MELSESARKILNDPSRIERRDRWFRRLGDVFDGVYTEEVPFISGILGCPADGASVFASPERWAAESLEDLAEKIERHDGESRFYAPCVQLDLYGVHFVDSLFGARVYYNGESRQWYNDFLKSEIGSLQYPDLSKCGVWETAEKSVRAFLELNVRLPLFGLPTIASVLNIAVNLYGGNILEYMLVEPEKANHDLSVINRLLVEIHTRFRSLLPESQLQPVIPWERVQPPGYGQICGCTTHLVGAGVYKDQVSALDDALLGAYPHGGMIHLCGSHSHLIPVFRSMQNLRAVQVNDRAALDLELYFNGLRGDQVIYLMPCEQMTVGNAMDITGGKRLVIIDKLY